jgi:glutathione reductase (NADPH)
MASYDFDYFVIGGGSAGLRSARVAAGHGARVGIAEERYWGGTCVNVGCVPKKLMAIGAHFSADFADSAGFGWTASRAVHDWKTLISRKEVEVKRLNVFSRSLLTNAGCTVFDDRATLVGPHTIEVAGRHVTADRVLIASGGRPVRPNRPGVEEHAFTSDEVFSLEQMPRRILIVGGGYISMEFAGIFHGLGAEVTVVCRSAMALNGFDDDARTHLAREMVGDDLTLHLKTDVDRVAKVGDRFAVSLSDGRSIAADGVMYATGRKPNVASIGAEAAGIALNEDGAIIVDERYRTNVPNIYALGDVTDRINLTPVAIAEGRALADTLFGREGSSLSYENVPTAVFSNPPIGTVGLTEAEARGRHGAVDVYRSNFRPLRHTLSGSAARTLVKLVVDSKTDRVLGCHMVGMDAPEIIQGFAVALNCGATKRQFDETIGLHPTAAEEFVTMHEKSGSGVVEAQRLPGQVS